MAALREEHGRLLKWYRENRDSPEAVARLEGFVSRGQATGALLEADRDRSAAQSLLDYWATIYYRASGDRPLEATLANFDARRVRKDLPESEYPYAGLSAFAEGESLLSRRQVVDDCLKKLEAGPPHLLVVVGPAGSGRSSLVRAGLLPALRAGAKDRHCFPPITPGPDPLGALARLVEPAAPRGERFRRDRRYLLQRVRAFVRKPVVLVVDRMEELFTRCRNDADRRAFVGNLRNLAQDAGGRHRVILALRTGAEKQVAELDPGFARLLEGARFLIPPPDAKDLREAISRPAERVGLKFEEGLVEKIAGDLVGHPAALPLLQFLLRRLWERREGNRITWDAYRDLGGRQAVDRCAEALYAELPEGDKEAARRLLLRLVRPGLGPGEVVTASVALKDLTAPAAGGEGARALIDRLAGVGLVRVRPGEAPGAELVEVVHEALICQWRRLLDWVEAERKHTGQRALLTRAAQQWRNLGADAKALWRGALLREAESFRDLAPLETEFVIASQAAQAREERRKRRLAYLGLAAALVIAFLLGLNLWGALRAYHREIKLTKLAESRGLAAQATSLQDGQLDLALLLSLEALNKADTVEARSSLLRGLHISPRLRTFLHGHTAAVFALAYSPDGKRLASAAGDGTVLVWDRTHPKSPPRTLRAGKGILRCLAFGKHAGKAVLASGGTEGQVRLWDVDSGKEVARFQPEMGKGGDRASVPPMVRSLAFSRDGTRLAVGTWSGSLGLWDVAGEPRRLFDLQGHSDSVNAVVFSPDGLGLVSGGADGKVLLWQVTGAGGGALPWERASGKEAKNEPKPIYDREGDFVNALAFSGDGRRLAAGLGDGAVIGWEMDQSQASQQTFSPRHGGESVTSLAFSPDNKTVAAGTTSRKVRLLGAEHLQPLGEPLTGHRETVWGVAFRPGGDGTELGTAGGDHRVILWTANAPAPLMASPAGHTGAITAVAFHPRGEWLASAGLGKNVLLWDLQTQRPFSPALRHRVEISTLAVRPDGNLLATGGVNGSVHLWNVRDPQAPRLLGELGRGHRGEVNGLAFSPDGKWLASSGRDEFLRLWDLADPGKDKPAAEEKVRPRRLAFARERPVLAVACPRNKIIRYEVNQPDQPLRDKKELRTTEEPLSLALSPDGRWLAWGGDRGSVWMLDLGDKSPQPLPVRAQDGGGHTEQVSGLAFSPDGKWLASASDDETVGLWELATRQGRRFGGHRDAVLSVAFGSLGGGLVLASGSRDKTIVLWDVSASPPPRLVRKPGYPLNRMDVTTVIFGPDPDRRLLAVGRADGTFTLWDVKRQEPLGEPVAAHPGGITSLALSRDGKRLASGGADGRVRLWDLTDPALPRAVGDPTPLGRWGVFALAFGPDARLLASGRDDQTVYAWDVTNREQLGDFAGSRGEAATTLLKRAGSWDVSQARRIDFDHFAGHGFWGNSLAFHPNGALLAAAGKDNAGKDNQVVLRDVNTWRQIGALDGSAGQVLSLAFSPDGALLAAGGSDHTVVLWDTRGLPDRIPPSPGPAGNPATLSGNTDMVRAVAFSPDGKLLAAGAADGKIRLYDVATRQPLGLPLSGHAAEIKSLAFSADNGLLASGDVDGTLRLWDTSVESWKEQARAIANRKLTEEEKARYLPTDNSG